LLTGAEINSEIDYEALSVARGSRDFRPQERLLEKSRKRSENTIMNCLKFILLACFVLCSQSQARASDYAPDPASVQREGAGYRYPQAGWIVLHIEGAPYERGYQHGKLLAHEIAAYMRCYAQLQSSKSPSDG